MVTYEAAEINRSRTPHKLNIQQNACKLNHETQYQMRTAHRIHPIQHARYQIAHIPTYSQPCNITTNIAATYYFVEQRQQCLYTRIHPPEARQTGKASKQHRRAHVMVLLIIADIATGIFRPIPYVRQESTPPHARCNHATTQAP